LLQTAWNKIADTVIGVASGDNFGLSISLSVDGNTVGVGAENDENGIDSGHIRIFSLQTMILAKEYGWCLNLHGAVQADGVIELSQSSFGPSSDLQLECRNLCVENAIFHAQITIIHST